MKGEQNLAKLLKEMAPRLNQGEFVFITTPNLDLIPRNESICEFKEKEGITFVITKRKAEELGLGYAFVASWITLDVHSSLAAIGLTGAVSSTLAQAEISCNIIAAYYHDHIFVDVADAERAIEVLKALSKDNRAFG